MLYKLFADYPPPSRFFIFYRVPWTRRAKHISWWNIKCTELLPARLCDRSTADILWLNYIRKGCGWNHSSTCSMMNYFQFKSPWLAKRLTLCLFCFWLCVAVLRHIRCLVNVSSLSGRTKNEKHGTLNMVFNNDMDLWEHTFIFCNIYKGKLCNNSAVSAESYKTK